DLRNGMQFPLRLGARGWLDCVRHPAWSLATLRAGVPRYVNFDPYFPPAKRKTMSRTAFINSFAAGAFDWPAFARLRREWSGTLIIKGLMASDDVATAIDHGADGIILSNHGGRQCDASPATIEALPGGVAAASGRVPIMLDSGIRRGTDVV